jgi:hypothetical protein
MGRAWTENDIAKLKTLAGKLPVKDIAVELGRSSGATIVQAHKLGLSLQIFRGCPLRSFLSPMRGAGYAPVPSAGKVHANRSAPAGVNRTKVPLSCMVSHPRSKASFMPAPYSAGLPLSLNRKVPLIS